ncbi:MAG: transposase zinc-binding domain-containing protein, partial [Limisphaerales bacterium]
MTLVDNHSLESWLAPRQALHEGVAGNVEEEFRAYQRCGILCHGFARARCLGCSHAFLIAFSCKRRVVCPSCNGRHMAQTAAHLADRPQVVGALTKILLADIERSLLTASGVSSDAGTPSASRLRLGAVFFLHRFGSSWSCHRSTPSSGSPIWSHRRGSTGIATTG